MDDLTAIRTARATRRAVRIQRREEAARAVRIGETAAYAGIAAILTAMGAVAVWCGYVGGFGVTDPHVSAALDVLNAAGISCIAGGFVAAAFAALAWKGC